MNRHFIKNIETLCLLNISTFHFHRKNYLMKFHLQAFSHKLLLSLTIAYSLPFNLQQLQCCLYCTIPPYLKICCRFPAIDVTVLSFFFDGAWLKVNQNSIEMQTRLIVYTGRLENIGWKSESKKCFQCEHFMIFWS